MKSITLRLAVLTGLWVLVGLTVVGIYVTGIATRGLQEATDARISVLHDTVTANIKLDVRGKIQAPNALPAPEFDNPLSGVYWQISAGGTVLRSKSLWDTVLPEPKSIKTGPVWSTLKGPRGEELRMLERNIVLPDAASSAWVQVAVSQDKNRQEIASLRNSVALGLSALGALLIAGVGTLIVAGLRPLRQAKQALRGMRRGQSGRLTITAPQEIAPLFAEINALIAENQKTIERARSHVGNLAHALKTPLTVITNTLESTRPDLSLARQQLKELNRTVAHHLARARVSARSAAISTHTASFPLAIAGEVASALRRIAPQLETRVDGDATAQVAINRQDLIELLGNLMDNAVKWAKSKCLVEIRNCQNIPPDGKPWVEIQVQDDGPGMANETTSSWTCRRGEPSDESQAGSGLGLLIAKDITTLYGGSLTIDPKGALGGVRVTVLLPAFHAETAC